MKYWAIENVFSEFNIKTHEELLFCGEYGPEYYKARRKYGDEKRGKWTVKWLPIKYANYRILGFSIVLTPDNEKTKEEINKFEREE